MLCSVELQARNADADEKVLKELSTQIKRLAARYVELLP